MNVCVSVSMSVCVGGLVSVCVYVSVGECVCVLDILLLTLAGTCRKKVRYAGNISGTL